MQELNIVKLIESNPISKLSNVYNGKLLTKIKIYLQILNSNYLLVAFIVI